MFYLWWCALWQQDYYKVIANFSKYCVRHVKYQLKITVDWQISNHPTIARPHVPRIIQSRSAYIREA